MKDQIAKEITRIMEEKAMTEYSVLRDGIDLSRTTVRSIIGRTKKGYNIDSLFVFLDFLGVGSMTVDLESQKVTISDKKIKVEPIKTK